MSAQQPPPTPVRLNINQSVSMLAIEVANVIKALSEMEQARLFQQFDGSMKALQPNVKSINFALAVIGMAYMTAVSEARDAHQAAKAAETAAAT